MPSLYLFMKNMKKKALVTGITGQDGSYLTELLLEKGYEVHGIRRRSSSFNTGRIDHLIQEPIAVHTRDLTLHYGDITDSSNILGLISQIKPDEIYNLAAQSHVGVSFEQPEYTGNVDALGTLRILEAIRLLKLETNVKFYQASTSELYGKVLEIPQSETTPFNPQSPYAIAKLYSFWMCKHYREAYGIFACNGILFNHESPRRGETFVTRKITRGLTRIFCGLQDCLIMGNLDSLRDWGHAKDFVEAQWLILQQTKADDFVISTGAQYSVRDFINISAQELGMDIAWSGEGTNEVGVWNKKVIIRVDPAYYRPTEVDTLLGDCSKAKSVLGWEQKHSFKELVSEMILSDLNLAKADKLTKTLK